MRSFIACTLPPEASKQLTQLLQQLRDRQPDEVGGLRLIPPDNYHITLQFLGDVSVDQFQILNQALARSLVAVSQTELNFNRVQVFPRQGGRVLAACADTSPELIELQSLIHSGCKSSVPLKEQLFRPHITWARSRHPIHLQGLPQPLTALQIQLKQVLWMESTLTPQGSEYRCMRSYPLGQ